MDKQKAFDAVDKFLDDLYKKGKSDVVCPFCKSELLIDGDIRTSYEVRCMTENCLKITFRGI